MKNNCFGALDIFRIIAAALVVAIHSPKITFLGEYGNLLLTGAAARLAVPFFFSVTGFFTDFKSAEKLKKLLWKTAALYAAASAVYLPYGSYYSSVKQILFDGTFYHLWYFPALGIGAIIVFALRRLPNAAALVIASALYAVGLCGDAYRPLAEGFEPFRAALGALSNVFSYTRNGIFFAPIFLALGNLIGDRRRAEQETKRRPISGFICAAGLALSLILLVLERFSLRTITLAPRDNMFIALIPCTVFLLPTLSSIKQKPLPALRKISMWIYIIHPIIIDLITKISTAAVTSDDAEKAAVSLLTAAGLALLTGRPRRLGKKLGHFEKIKS